MFRISLLSTLSSFVLGDLTTDPTDHDYFGGFVFNGLCASCVAYKAVFCMASDEHEIVTDELEGTCVPSPSMCHDENKE